jgi:hypothetical protein
MPVNLNGNELNSLGVKLLNDTSFVKTNLRFLWDAGLPSSYPGSGTSWYEWVDSTARTGTFTNGPTFSTAGGGSILFDGSNDYIQFSTFDLGGPPWSTSFWFKTSSTDGGLFSHYSGGPVYNAFETQSGKLTYRYYNNLGWNQSPYSTTSVNTNTWVYATFSTGASATSTFTYYLNGVVDGSFNPAGNGIGSGNMGSIGMLWGFSNWNGYIAHVSVHSTQLTQAQILQNFNSTRQRFGV